MLEPWRPWQKTLMHMDLQNIIDNSIFYIYIYSCHYSPENRSKLLNCEDIKVTQNQPSVANNIPYV